MTTMTSLTKLIVVASVTLLTACGAVVGTPELHLATKTCENHGDIYKIRVNAVFTRGSVYCNDGTVHTLELTYK